MIDATLCIKYTDIAGEEKHPCRYDVSTNTAYIIADDDREPPSFLEESVSVLLPNGERVNDVETEAVDTLPDATHEPIPADFAVQPLKKGQEAKDKVTCGHCGLSWDDAIPTSWTPAPSARCPFEYFHVYPDTAQTGTTKPEKNMSKPLSELFQGRMTLEERFLKGYVLAALHMMEDEEDDPDAEEKNTRNVTVDDLAPETIKSVKADCAKFFAENEADVTNDDALLRRPDGSTEESAGHDFFMTRHHHGVGFWDGDWEKEAGERLTAAANAFKETDWYVGDDGKVYIMGTEGQC